MNCPFCNQPGSWPTCLCPWAIRARAEGFNATWALFSNVNPSFAKPLDAQPLHPAATQAVSDFAEAILHGSDEHRQWLRNAAKAFIAGNPIPPPQPASEKHERKKKRADPAIRPSPPARERAPAASASSKDRNGRQWTVEQRKAASKRELARRAALAEKSATGGDE